MDLFLKLAWNYNLTMYLDQAVQELSMTIYPKRVYNLMFNIELTTVILGV